MDENELLILEDGVMDQALGGHQAIMDDLQSRVYSIIQSDADAQLKVDSLVHMLVISKQRVELHGRSLIAILGIAEENWSTLKPDEDFQDYMFEHVGVHRHTIDRYVKLYKAYQKHPALIDKTIKAAIPIANKLAQGYEFSDDTWQKLDGAPDYHEVTAVLSDFTDGKGERSNQLRLWMDRSGAIWAYTKDDQRVFVGSLEVNMIDDPTTQKAIDRIVSNSGILKE